MTNATGETTEYRGLSIINGALTAPSAWSGVLLQSDSACGFHISGSDRLVEESVCGDKSNCSQCGALGRIESLTRQKEGADAFYAIMEAADVAICVIASELASRFAALCGLPPDLCFGLLRVRAADADPESAGALAGCGLNTALLSLLYSLEGASALESCERIRAFWADMLAANERETGNEADWRRVAFGAGAEIALAIAARFESGDAPGFAGDPAPAGDLACA